MTTPTRLLLLCAPLAACSMNASSSGQGQTAVDAYDQVFRFDTPVPAELFLSTRTIDDPAHLASYQVEIDDRPLELVFQVTPTAPRPLTITVYDGTTAAALLELAADDHTLEVRRDGQPLITVSDYVTPDLATVSGGGDTIDPVAIRALRAALPARAELGRIPGFFLNRDDIHDLGGGVSSSSSDARLLVPSWSAPVSVLGAFTLASVCTTATAPGYACDFCAWETAAAGRLAGSSCP